MKITRQAHMINGVDSISTIGLEELYGMNGKAFEVRENDNRGGYTVTLFSYFEPIAKIWRPISGEEYISVIDNRLSATSRKHLNAWAESYFIDKDAFKKCDECGRWYKYEK